ncbi:hypothetical protein [Kitasatospora sp. NPDC057500]|uniref:hypothetical protein n=1 Tax=Kitasatospora sp. NPDC057500 TaxID=3346151 RepID=UPI0036BB18EA
MRITGQELGRPSGTGPVEADERRTDPAVLEVDRGWEELRGKVRELDRSMLR